jgi:hypothetical protein
LQSLFDYQAQFAARLLGLNSDGLPDEAAFEESDVVRLRAHRDTVFRSLTHALQSTFCTIHRLIGTASFEKAAVGYIREFPPESAILSRYGRNFPPFLSRALPEYPCLQDVARFDALIEQVGRQISTEMGNRVCVAHSTRLRLPRSLRCARFEYAVDPIRAAIAAGSTDLESDLLLPACRNLVIWRTSAGVAIECFSGPTFLFLEALTLGCCTDEAIARALDTSSLEVAVAAIEQEVLNSPLVAWSHSYAQS